MNARGLGRLRFVVAGACFVLSMLALRAALRRMIVAVALWMLGGALFMTGLAFVAAGGWRFIRARIAYRRSRPSP